MSDLKILRHPNGYFEYQRPRRLSDYGISLPAGVYQTKEEFGFGGDPMYFYVPVNVDNDPPLDIRPEVREITEEIRQFFSPEIRSFFKRFNFAHKRGYLFYGEPGTGKSATLRLLEQRFVERFDGIVLLWDHDTIQPFVRKIREEEPDRPIMVVAEDIESRIGSFEVSILEFLDGQVALNNFVLVATTNHLESIPDRIKARPSRIDRVLEIKAPDAEARAAYLKRLGLTDAEVAQILPHTEGLSMAHLKEAVISVMGFGRSPEETGTRLRSLVANQEDVDSIRIPPSILARLRDE